MRTPISGWSRARALSFGTSQRVANDGVELIVTTVRAGDRGDIGHRRRAGAGDSDMPGRQDHWRQPRYAALIRGGVRRGVSADWGPVAYDLCYGGVFYALVDVDQNGLTIAPENARDLAEIGVALRDRIADQTEIVHPEPSEVHGLAYVMIRARDEDGAMRHYTTLKPARADRSPCGTDINSTMAVLHANG